MKFVTIDCRIVCICQNVVLLAMCYLILVFCIKIGVYLRYMQCEDIVCNAGMECVFHVRKVECSKVVGVLGIFWDIGLVGCKYSNYAAILDWRVLLALSVHMCTTMGWGGAGFVCFGRVGLLMIVFMVGAECWL